MREFDDVGNYRGQLQIKEEDGRYYWRVDCDVDNEPWIEIDITLYTALIKFHAKTDGTGAINQDEIYGQPSTKGEQK